MRLPSETVEETEEYTLITNNWGGADQELEAPSLGAAVDRVYHPDAGGLGGAQAPDGVGLEPRGLGGGGEGARRGAAQGKWYTSRGGLRVHRIILFTGDENL